MTDKGKLIGYIPEECKNCGRVRVEQWGNGDKICEKCNWNQDKGDYEADDRYSGMTEQSKVDMDEIEILI